MIEKELMLQNEYPDIIIIEKNLIYEDEEQTKFKKLKFQKAIEKFEKKHPKAHSIHGFDIQNAYYSPLFSESDEYVDEHEELFQNLKQVKKIKRPNSLVDKNELNKIYE